MIDFETGDAAAAPKCATARYLMIDRPNSSQAAFSFRAATEDRRLVEGFAFDLPDALGVTPKSRADLYRAYAPPPPGQTRSAILTIFFLAWGQCLKRFVEKPRVNPAFRPAPPGFKEGMFDEISESLSPPS